MPGRTALTRSLAALAAGLLLTFPGAAAAQPGGGPQAPCALPTANLDPQQLVERCAACARAGRLLDAGKLWYATSIRLRTLAVLDEREDRTRALMASLQSVVGQPVNAWLGGDLRDWLGAIDWDRRTDFPDLAGDVKGLAIPADARAAREAYGQQRAGIAALRASLAKDPGALYRQRRANGLEVRDPRFDAATGRMRGGGREP